jgi:hypothetical protein
MLGKLELAPSAAVPVYNAPINSKCPHAPAGTVLAAEHNFGAAAVSSAGELSTAAGATHDIKARGAERTPRALNVLLRRLPQCLDLQQD